MHKAPLIRSQPTALYKFVTELNMIARTDSADDTASHIHASVRQRLSYDSARSAVLSPGPPRLGRERLALSNNGCGRFRNSDDQDACRPLMPAKSTCVGLGTPAHLRITWAVAFQSIYRQRIS